MKILLLGASGNIGVQTLDILFQDKEHFSLVGISVGKNTRCISKIINKFPQIKHICIQKKKNYKYLKF
jgi:1-deoxy-D-xylulose-5-phosphate reductoisomerase